MTTNTTGANTVSFNISNSPGISRNLGSGQDCVNINHASSVDQIRLTFTSSEVGNGMARDSNTLANQDGGLAVRVQRENSAGDPAGPTSRFDDEGIIFTTVDDATFDVRDLVSGVSRGNYFDEVILGTSGADTFDETGSKEEYYINGGMGNDRLTGGVNRDFLVGGAGNDTLNGKAGNDSLIGGAGDDTIFGGNGNDLAILNAALDGSDRIDLGNGSDNLSIIAPDGGQIRLTFTSAEVGNGGAADSGLLGGQDGGLAVRLQLEGSGDTLAGAVSRVDDEGITFSTVGTATFDVRDLVSGAARGDQFDEVILGTEGNNSFDERGSLEAYYINAGAGNDSVTGGKAADFLVGGIGNDSLNGRAGNDKFIGGGGDDTITGGSGADTFIFTAMPGSDTITDFTSGSDKLDLRAFVGIDANDVTETASGANTIVSVDTNNDSIADFSFTLLNAPGPADGDYLFA